MNIKEESDDSGNDNIVIFSERGNIFLKRVYRRKPEKKSGKKNHQEWQERHAPKFPHGAVWLAICSPVRDDDCREKRVKVEAKAYRGDDDEGDNYERGFC